ncbi:MAG TPA: peptidylprolyl isomerase [Fibrobacteraceae bacterium]|nr:peptidylprolyl isomerase [Fibrobacteraceae bacterium]
MLVCNNAVVNIHYTLTNLQGSVVDSSSGQEPLAYIQGLGQIVPGLEKAMDGRKAGDHFQISLNPEEGYGLRDEAMLDEVPREAFGEGTSLEPGMEFYADGPHGPVVVIVKEIRDDKVLVDGNHPLAGEVLNFDIEVVDVREATQEEMSHGHVHGPGGQQH